MAVISHSDISQKIFVKNYPLHQIAHKAKVMNDPSVVRKIWLEDNKSIGKKIDLLEQET